VSISAEDLKAKVVLFLGSGFSAALDLPTTNQLSEKLLVTGESPEINQFEKFISTRIAEFWGNVFGWKLGMKPPTLEDHFTQIDMAANAGHHLGPQYSPRRLRAIRRMTIHRIFSLLKSRGIQSHRVLELFKRFSETFDTTLVTTNWDTEAEGCLQLLGIRPNYGLDEITETERLPPGEGIPVLKLHGCINRGYCDCCRSLIRFEGIENAVISLQLLLGPEDFELFDGGKELADILRKMQMKRSAYSVLRKCGGCGAPVSLRVATFSYRKDLSADAFYTVWDKARTSLQLAEKWLFVGYSLPEADVDIRHLLKAAQLARRHPSNVSVDVVLKSDRESGEADRYQRFFGLRDDQLFYDGLEDWISSNLKGYCG
jgi:hypothetical protein